MLSQFSPASRGRLASDSSEIVPNVTREFLGEGGETASDQRSTCGSSRSVSNEKAECVGEPSGALSGAEFFGEPSGPCSGAG